MRRAGVNLVTVGVFAWSRLEPGPGRYDFGWLDGVLDLLHGGGIGVDLATPTASPPPWFSLAHPDALPVTADGVRLHHGSRDTYCAAAPAYRGPPLRHRRRPRRALRATTRRWRCGTCTTSTAPPATATTPRRVPALAARPVRRPGRAQRRLDDRVLGPALHGLGPRRPAPGDPVPPQPGQALDFRRFVSDEMLGHVRRAARPAARAQPRRARHHQLRAGDWVPRRPLAAGRARWTSSPSTTTPRGGAWRPASRPPSPPTWRASLGRRRGPGC